jgi:hypothetical protein
MTLAFPITFEKTGLTDFNIFYLVSTMIKEGQLSAAYVSETFLLRQADVPGYDGSEMFWSYPPHFNLVVAPLSSLPLAVSYFLFTLITLIFYTSAIRALAGPAFQTIIVLFLPLVFMIILSGQNSFLTGGLIIWTCVLAKKHSRGAGFPLGLMAIKPHLALGFGIWALLDRRWWMAMFSLIVVALVSILATFVFGLDVWSYSIGAIADAGHVLSEGRYPLFRMTSLYAFAISLGIGHSLALSLHLVGVVTSLIVLVVLSRVKLPQNVFMGSGVFVSGLISPYNYDYDLAMLAASACLLISTVRHYASKLEKFVIISGVILIGTYGFLLKAITLYIMNTEATPSISLQGPVLFAGGFVLLRIVWRSRNEECRF